MSKVSNQEVNSGVSEPDFEASVLMEDQQQSVTATETSLLTVDQNAESADQDIDKDDVGITASLADSVSIAADSDSAQEAVLSAVPERSVKAVSQLTTGTSVSISNTCQPIRIMSAVSSTGQTSGVSLATKSPAFVFCQVTSGGSSSFVPRSAVGGIQLSSGTPASSTTSISHVPVFRSLQTVSSDVQGIATVTSTSSSVPPIIGIQTSAGVRLLRQAADGVRVVAGTTNAGNRASVGLTLNRGTAPQRLALAIAPANSAIRPTGIGSIRLVAVRNGTPVAIGGVASGGSAVGSPQLKLLTPAVPLSGVRPLTSLSTGMTAASASTVSTVKQQTAVNDVQAYLRRIQELKSAQPDQGAKTPVTLAAAVRTPLKAKTPLPTTLTSSQQIVVLQPGSQPQLANISANQLQLVSIFVASCCYFLLYYVICNKSFK